MGRREEPAWTKGTLGLTVARERGDVARKFQNRLTVTRSMIERLGLEKELQGHMGCVNCLEWNRDGSILASASDDLHVILWDPYRYKQISNISTGHTGNIFSVKFLTPDLLATSAADGSVRVRTLSTDEPLLECGCHCGRVKRLACSPDNSEVFWSAGEDGLVLQHDLRTTHRCNSQSSNVLVNLLNHLGKYAEAKCLAVNPRRPYQLAVGANDFYVRLYDTRMIRLSKLQESPFGSATSGMIWERQNMRCSRAGYGDPDNNIPSTAVKYYAPGHLSMELTENSFPKKATTYVAFSHDGNELLVNLGSEQIYVFDINSDKRPVLVESFITEHNLRRPRRGEGEEAAAESNGDNGSNDAPVVLPDKIQHLKTMANEMVNNGNFSVAVETYNVAIHEYPSCAILYSNRAAALMRRGWSGDTYAAIRDCYKAVKLDPGHVKSHFRLAKGLMDVKRAREARECLRYFKDKFPRHASSHAVFLLQKDIKMALKNLPPEDDDEDSQPGSTLERQLREAALDYSERFLGHCNTTTDIKEANFLGPDAGFVVAGSDDGSMFIWGRDSGNIVRCLRADESIVNCVQLHPTTFLLATSGIEAVVRLWSPLAEDGRGESRVVPETSAAAAANQQRMRSDPFEAMLLNISFAGGADREASSPACRAT